MRTLTLAVVAAAWTLACAGPRTSLRVSPLVGKPVAIDARALDGTSVKLPAGDAKVTVVDFWATWCDPCREQIPELDRLAAALRRDGVRVYAIAFDEDRAAVEEFLARTPVRFPVLWDKGGEGLAEKLALERLPTTMILDGAGVVRVVHLGYESGEGAALEKEIRRVLAE